jgi:ATP/maltotriose-dependent transcriptional regulator MalT
MVGRAAELARLGGALRRAESGSPGTILVGGEAGVGKTRLLREFTGHADADGARTLVGACVDLGSGDLPYAPVVDALRALVRAIGADAVRELVGPAYPALARLAPFLGDLRDPALPDKTGRSQLFEGILRLLDQLGSAAPVVLVIEDLHWADRSTLDLLSFLVRTLSAERLLILASYRSTDLWPGHPLRPVIAELGRTRRVERVELAPFDIDELRDFATALLGSAPSRRQVDHLFELSDGNAFFVEELVAAGALDDPPPGPSDQPTVPQLLRDVVIARMDALSEAAHDVLRTAATAGRYVSHRLLAAACELSGPALLAALRECVDHHVLASDPGADAYAFRHALAREAVYQGLIAGDRMRLHAAVAAALDRDHSLAYTRGRSVATELAHHWYHAGDTRRALPASVRAGRDAADVYAFAESERQYTRAAALWAQTAEPATIAGMSHVDLLTRAAEAAWWAGHVEDAIARIREALGEVPPERTAERAALHERLGRYRWENGDAEGTLWAYAEADTLLRAQPPSALRARVRAVRAMALVRAGDHAHGLQLAEEAVDMARAVGAVAEEGIALNPTGLALAVTGRTEEAVKALREATEIARAAGHLEDLHRSYANLAFALESTGRLEEALDVAMESIEHGRRLGLPVIGGGLLHADVAILLQELGRWDEAVRISLDVLSRDTPLRSASYVRLVLAEIDVCRGRFAAAEAQLATCRETVPRLDAPHATASLYACLAELAIWRHRYEEASASISEGLRGLTDFHDMAQLLRLCALGARVEAEVALRRAALGHRAPPRASAVDSLCAQVEGAMTAMDADDLVPEAAVLHRQAKAERSRPDPAPNGADLWADVASGWSRLSRPYPAAYASLRRAEALLTANRDAASAATALREAHRTSVELGAGPLRDEIDALARSARIELAGVAEPRPGPAGPADPFGLTERERQVLDLLAEGIGNKQIARRLYIAEKTVSVHVSRILRKLNASTRGEAVAIARRFGLIRTDGHRTE